MALIVKVSSMDDSINKRFTISIAGHTIAINALYTEVYELCNDYLSDMSPELQIFISEEDIAIERSEPVTETISERNSYLETLTVYRKITEEMLRFDTLLMHGAVIATGNDAAYMFTANSGTGKTTHIKKWLNNVKGSFVVNGDKPLIKITEDQVIACGTPWCGKEHMGTNTMIPLKAIVLMERGEDNTIEEITFSKAFTQLLQQTYRPKDGEKMKSTLGLLLRLNGKVRFFKFKFNNYKEDSFNVAYNALSS